MTQPRPENREERNIRENREERNIREEKAKCCKGPGYEAFQILRFTFTIAPILAGLDKFFYFLTDWTQYLSPTFDVFQNPQTTMLVVGVVEIIAGIGVWFKPRIFSYVVALWLLAIIVNLLLLQNFYDIALRDFGLMLSALALGCLSKKYDSSCCHKDNVSSKSNY